MTIKGGVGSIVVAIIASVAGDYGNVVGHTSKLFCNLLELECADDPSNPPVTLPLSDVREIDRKLAACQQQLTASAELIVDVNQHIGQFDVQRFSEIISDLGQNPQINLPNEVLDSRFSQSLDALSELDRNSSDLLENIVELQSGIVDQRTDIEQLMQSFPRELPDASL